MPRSASTAAPETPRIRAITARADSLGSLSVAIAALRDVAAEDEPSQFDRLNAKYLVNTTEPKASDRWARLVPGEEDEQAYWTVLTDPANASGHTAIGNAYRFFLKRIGGPPTMERPRAIAS